MWPPGQLGGTLGHGADGEMGDCPQLLVGKCLEFLDCTPVPRSFYGLGWGTQAEPQAEPQGIR